RFLLPGMQHALDLVALQVLLRAAEVARNDRELAEMRPAGDVLLAAIRQRTDDDVAAVVGLELRRHRLQLAAVEEIQEERLENVIGMMTERDLGDAVLGREGVQRAATQARAQRTGRLALRDDALDHAVGILLEDREFHADGGEVFRQYVLGEAGLLLV